MVFQLLNTKRLIASLLETDAKLWTVKPSNKVLPDIQWFYFLVMELNELDKKRLILNDGSHWKQTLTFEQSATRYSKIVYIYKCVCTVHDKNWWSILHKSDFLTKFKFKLMCSLLMFFQVWPVRIHSFANIAIVLWCFMLLLMKLVGFFGSKNSIAKFTYRIYWNYTPGYNKNFDVWGGP